MRAVLGRPASLGIDNDTVLGSIRNCEVVLKLERFSHPSGRSFRLSLDAYHWCFH